jgi:hypothetical protein
MTWRVGRKVGRTIYEGDTLVGVMDTPELAALVVEAVNAAEGQIETTTPRACGGVGPCRICNALQAHRARKEATP